MRPATDALIVIDVQNDFCPGARWPWLGVTKSSAGSTG